jgi:plastocyanin
MTTKDSGVRKTVLLGVGLISAFALSLAACGGGSSSSSPKLSGKVTNKGTQTLSGSSLKLEADDYYFKPTFIDAKPGTKLTVDVENEGKQVHTFTIASASVDEQISPGKSTEVHVTVPSSGNLNFFCRFHRSLGMQGAIVAKS